MAASYFSAGLRLALLLAGIASLLFLLLRVAMKRGSSERTPLLSGLFVAVETVGLFLSVLLALYPVINMFAQTSYWS